MGFFRGGLLFTVCILLFVSLLTANLFLTLSTSLKYENVQKEVSSLALGLSNESGDFFSELGSEEFNFSHETDEAQKVMSKHCQNNINYTFDFEGRTISVPCSTLEQGKEAVINETINSIIKDLYYKEYDCGFWKCLVKEQAPFFLVSQKARDYWKEKLYISLVVSLFLVLLIFFLVEKKLNWPVLVGSILILSAFPLLKIKDFISFLIPERLTFLLLFLNIFFSKAYAVFWISFVSGLVIVGLGLGLKFSNTEFVRKITEKQDKKEAEKKAGEKVLKKKKTKKK